MLETEISNIFSSVEVWDDVVELTWSQKVWCSSVSGDIDKDNKT